MKLGRWSQTAASNNNTPPDGWPEGQAPSTVNDCAREMMASIRAAFSDLQFFDQDFTPTYVSATSFTVPGDQTSAIHAGRRLKIYDATAGVATTIYATVATASFTVVTTVSVANDAGQLTSSLSSFAIAIISNTNNSLPRTYDRISASAIEATTLTVSGATILKSTLSVSGDVVITGLVSGSNAVFGRGASNAKVNLAGSSVTTASGCALLVRAASPTLLEIVRGDEAVAYDLLVANLAAGGTLTVGGATVLKGALSVGGAVNFASTLTVGTSVVTPLIHADGTSALMRLDRQDTGAAAWEFVAASNKLNIFSQNAGWVGDRLYVHEEGGVTIPVGALTLTGGQITFPATQNASANANTLDDYEENTYTPVLKCGATAVAATVAAGRYTKVGNKVTFSSYFQVAAMSAQAGNATMSLPFSADTGVANGYVTLGSFYLNGAVSITAATMTSINPGEGVVNLWQGLGNLATLTQVNFTAGTVMIVSGSYFTP